MVARLTAEPIAFWQTRQNDTIKCLKAAHVKLSFTLITKHHRPITEAIFVKRICAAMHASNTGLR
eukprot:scaffold5572_cov390-Prasinococcus_capsulatus_cf.AAC.6